MTDDVRQSFGGWGPLPPLLVGEPYFGSDMLAMTREWTFDPIWHESFSRIGRVMLADCDGDRAQLKAQIDSSLHHLVDELTPHDDAMWTYSSQARGIGRTTHTMTNTLVRIRDADGDVRGTVWIGKPGAGMYSLAVMAVQHDLDHLERMQHVMSADRRPTAILFADLEASSPLARRLSTASYFALNRRLVRVSDTAVINAGGLVGRHVGDGVVAFFPAVTFGSESEAARACIQAARSIRSAAKVVAERSDLAADEVVMRFGLHWGATPYIGGISTGARTEVTALGDEINEAARIEACAIGGRILASKQLIERLNRADAASAQVDTEHITYTQLGDLDTATDKARRDAPSIAVCDLPD